MKLALIGRGAIASYAKRELTTRGHKIEATLLRPERLPDDPTAGSFVGSVSELAQDITHVLDCAGHAALRQFGGDVLRSGRDLITVSVGALADPRLVEELEAAGQSGGSALHLASGAIGALDALKAARIGDLHSVRYTGRKPPKGWAGSPAEEVLDLTTLTDRAATHFTGTARDAALRYPKNANVAAAVALAGLGFDRTKVTLIADPGVTANIHEVTAEGDFGTLSFQIEGAPLPDNPRSSALAAMSAVGTVDMLARTIRI